MHPFFKWWFEGLQPKVVKKTEPMPSWTYTKVIAEVKDEVPPITTEDLIARFPKTLERLATDEWWDLAKQATPPEPPPPEPKLLWKVRAFPKHYQVHNEHDILFFQATRGEVDYMLTHCGQHNWFFKGQDGFDACFMNTNYRNFIIEPVKEEKNDGDSVVQCGDTPGAGQEENKGCDSGDRCRVVKSRSRKRPRKSDDQPTE